MKKSPAGHLKFSSSRIKSGELRSQILLLAHGRQSKGWILKALKAKYTDFRLKKIDLI